MIVINFKNYKPGKEALKLAELIHKHLPRAIACVPATEIGYLSYYSKLKIYAQHIDAVEDKRSTGFISPLSVKSYGAQGTLLNHSEHRLNAPDLQKTIHLCKKHKLHTIVCVKDLSAAKLVKSWKPDAIAFEEPSLIASGKSITKVMPDILKHFSKLLKNSNIIPICGAGISTIEDVKAAFNFGCKGVLIASAIADSKNPSKFLKKLANVS